MNDEIINNRPAELDIECWSNDFYNQAYSIVKNNRYPIVIPSYNNPNGEFLQWIVKSMNKEHIYDVYFVIRQSQYELYSNNELTYNDFIHLVPVEDELINSAGKVRNYIVSTFAKKYDNIFMIDDDISNISHTVPTFTKNNKPKAKWFETIDAGNEFAMWQISHEYMTRTFDTVISCGITDVHSWSHDFIWVENSARLLSGSFCQTLCINIKKLIDLDVNYRDNYISGHEDYDLIVRLIQKRQLMCQFKWLSYHNEPMKANFLNDLDTLQQRMEKQYNIMYSNFKDEPYMIFEIRNDLHRVAINWRKVYKLYSTLGVISFEKYSDKIFDIWRNGELLINVKNYYK